MDTIITPLSGTSILVVECRLILTVSVGARVIVSIFRDAIADALAAMTINIFANATDVMDIKFYLASTGIGVPTTFKVRYGYDTGGAASTIYTNQNSGGGNFGGVLQPSELKISEFQS